MMSTKWPFTWKRLRSIWTQAQRRVPVQHPTKRMVGRGMLASSTQTTYLPMQVNSTGMIPLILAQSLLLFPALLSQDFLGSPIQWLASTAPWVGTYLANPSLWYYWFTYFALVVAFTYFYAYVVWQQQKIPENLQKKLCPYQTMLSLYTLSEELLWMYKNFKRFIRNMSGLSIAMCIVRSAIEKTPRI